MYQNKHWFHNLNEFEEGKVLDGNKSEYKVNEIRTIWLILPDDTMKMLSEVRYVP